MREPLEPRPEYYGRFMEKVHPQQDGCWGWTAEKIYSGYGRFRLPGRNGRKVLAHRLSYEMFVGPIATGLHIDHTCRNRSCVNPDHLETVTHQENVRRGDSGKYLRERTHCVRGHEFTKENTYLRPEGGRGCKVCRARASRDHYRKASDVQGS